MTMSGQRPKYQVGEPDGEAETRSQCPCCNGVGMIPSSLAVAVKKAIAAIQPMPSEMKTGRR